MQIQYLNKICAARRSSVLISCQIAPKFKLTHKETYEPLDLLEGMMSSAGCYDRFKILNNSSIYKFTNSEEDTTFMELAKRSIPSMKDIMHNRAQELVEIARLSGLKLVIFWSGGVDSSSLLCALLMEGLTPENSVILCTENSRKEYPFMYKRLKQSGFKTDDFTDYADPRICYNKYNGNYFVLGWCADQLYGSFLNQYFDANENYKDSLVKLYTDKNPVYNFPVFKNGRPTKKDAEVAIEGIQKYAKALNTPLETLQDVTWMINFGVKWTSVSTNFALAAPSINVSKIINFFETDDFSAWSVQNLSRLRKLNQQNSKEYKWELKEIVYELLKDSMYLNNKGKVNSWVSNYSRGNMNQKTLSVLTNKGIHIFNNMYEQLNYLMQQGVLREGVNIEQSDF